MELTIVYDNETLRDDLVAAWGFACVIKTSEKNILFDTGWDGNILLSNMNALGVNPKDIDTIMLSHWHWDHIGGLPTILDVVQDAEIILPASFSNHLTQEIGRKHNVKLVKMPEKLFEGIYSTGVLNGNFQDTIIGEQSIAVKTSKGLAVITGCSHSGVEQILDSTAQFGKNYGLIGGLHGFEKYGILKDMGLITPTHCTQNKKEIRERYAEKIIEGGVGCKITID